MSGTGTAVDPWDGKTLSQNTYYGKKAVSKYEELYKVKLTKPQRRITEIEGFVNGYYKDHKGILTYGVGQTGEYIQKGFIKGFEEKQSKVEDIFGNVERLGEDLSSELIQLVYRGDVKASHEWVSKFNTGDYTGAAAELLNHKEYQKLKSDGTINSITKRLEVASTVIGQYSPTYETGE